MTQELFARVDLLWGGRRRPAIVSHWRVRAVLVRRAATTQTSMPSCNLGTACSAIVGAAGSAFTGPIMMPEAVKLAASHLELKIRPRRTKRSLLGSSPTAT